MIVELPYAHQMRCVPPGRTNHVLHVVSSVAPFEVPDVASGAAPEACALGGVVRRSWGGRSYRRLDVRLDEIARKLADMPWGASKVPGTLLREAFSGRGVPAASPFSVPTEVEQLRDILAAAKRGKDVKDVSDDKAEAAARAQAAWSRRLLVVDGEPWVVAPEPRYMLDMVHTSVVLVAGDGPDRRQARWTIPFRADRRDDATAYGGIVASRTKGRRFRDDVPHDGAIEVLSAEHLTFHEADAMASWVYDVTDERSWDSHGVQGSRLVEPLPAEHRLDPGRIDRRRGEGDVGWATDFLDMPLMTDRVGQAHRGYAHERHAHEEGTRVIHGAWRDVVRAYHLPPEVDHDEDVARFMPNP